MQAKHYHIAVAFVICCACQAHLLAQPPVYSPSDYRFQHYDMSDGLLSEFANEIVQDSLGFIWVLHNSGLSRYDGYTFKGYIYDPKDKMSVGPPLDGFLELDRSGSLWLISNQNHHPERQIIMTKYDREKDGFIKYCPKMDGASARKPCFDKNNTTVWIGSLGSGLYSFDILTGETKRYLNTPRNSIADLRRDSRMGQRNSIFEVSDQDSVLVLATGSGLWQFNRTTKVFSRPKCHPADSALLYNAPIVAIIESRFKDDFFVVVKDVGLMRIVPNSSEKATILLKGLSGLRNRSFQQDQDGVFWLADINEGLYRFDPRDGSLVTIKSDQDDPYALRSKFLRGFTIDRNQNLWIAAENHGISKLRRQSLAFHNYKFAAPVTGNTVYSAKNKNYLVVSQNLKASVNDIFFSVVETSSLSRLHFNKLNLDFKLNETVNQLVMGKTHLWIGTAGMGSVGGDGVVGLPLNPVSGLIESRPTRIFGHDPKNRNTIGGYNHTSGAITISGILEDQDSNLWVGSAGGGMWKINLTKTYGEEGSVAGYNHVTGDSTSLSNDIIWWEMYPESKNSHWVITASGLDLFRNGSFEHYFNNGHYVMTIRRDSKGVLLVGTEDGLYEGVPGERYSFKKYPSKHLAHSYAFQEDNLGRLWISTNRSIRCYDREQNVVIHFGDAEGARFAWDWVEKTDNGIFVTGDQQGITVFDPHSFKIDKTPTMPVLTRLIVNNELPLIGDTRKIDDRFPIKKDISVLDELVIDHKNNNFTIEFSAMQMTAPEKNLYRHKLEGFDKDWIETDYKSRTATYTNLNAGEYTFRIKASNHHGIWSDNERILKIIVLPPPWKTTWAYTGYGILFIGLLFAARKNIVQRERLKSNLKLAKVEQEKEHFELEKAKEVDKVKSAFFANISHEFRTPLTLIKGPVEEMMDEFGNHPKVKERMKLVQRNADLVLKLINQLLDLARLESGTLTVEKSNSDFNSFVSAVVNSFSSLAFQKNITLSTELPAVSYQLRFDKDKVETILINLINNAIKFTQAGGRVVINATYFSNSCVVLAVTDNGIGIPEEQQDKVFERFHQVSETHKEVGTGIGLALVKELVVLMDGTISLTSQPGKGSVFIVTLPIEQIRPLTETESVQDAAEVFYDDQFATTEEPPENGHDQLPHVLVVEDNSDLRKFIIDSLGKEFHFLEAADGKEGLEKAFEFVPDVIVSDVMMPEMDGITMTGKIKNDTRTSHIPLILLTAKTTDESKLAGLGTGADDYLTKPFNKNELVLKVRNGISLRVKLREKIKLELLKEGPKVEAQSADEQFLYNVRETILSRLSDEQLSVESLAEEVALSRSQLLRKITALTGMSVNELIRTFRLQKAAQLLEQNWGPVTQVAYEVGFSNLSYFSRAFKDKYGLLPSEYPIKTS